MSAGLHVVGTRWWASILMVIGFLVSSAQAAPESVRSTAVTPRPPIAPTGAPLAAITGIRQHFIQQESTSIPSGAGVRSFSTPPIGREGHIEFHVDWYAYPPGVPVQTLFLLEYLLQGQSRIRSINQTLPITVQGYQKMVMSIPADVIRNGGKVLAWRLTISWRGKMLAQQASEYWGIDE